MSLERFIAAYEPALRAAHAKDRERYAYLESEIPRVVDVMRRAIAEDKFNHDGPAFRAACKALGIKHTQTAIRDFCGVEKGGSKLAPVRVIPLVQGVSLGEGFDSGDDTKAKRIVMTVAIDATAEELRTIHVEHGISHDDYEERPLGQVELDRWRRARGLVLLPGERRFT